MTHHVCPWCQNDDQTMMEEVGTVVTAPGNNGSSKPKGQAVMLCFVCGKIFNAKEPPRG